MGSYATTSTLVLPHDDGAARTARVHLSSLAAGWDPQVLHAALLLISEAVTNAVRHAPGPVAVRVSDDGDHLAVHVVDGGTRALPAERCPHSPMPHTRRAGGRGLALIDLLADAWGSHLEDVEDRESPEPVQDGAGPHELTRSGEHHVVWFVLAHTARPFSPNPESPLRQ